MSASNAKEFVHRVDFDPNMTINTFPIHIPTVEMIPLRVIGSLFTVAANIYYSISRGDAATWRDREKAQCKAHAHVVITMWKAT